MMRDPKKYITQTLAVIDTFEIGLQKARDAWDNEAVDVIQRMIDRLHYNVGMATLELGTLQRKR